MRHKMMLLCAVLTGCTTGGNGGGGAAAARGDENPAEVEARVAGATFGRVAAAPVSCVQLDQIRGNRALSRDIVLFNGLAGRLYVNRVSGCTALRYNRALVVRGDLGRICRGEQVQVVDPGTRTVLGTCALGDFLPFVPRG